MRKKIRPVIISMVAPIFGIIIFAVIAIAFKVNIPKLYISIANLLIVSFIALYLFPKVLGIPFGKIQPEEFIKRICVFPSNNVYKHIILGIVLAVCSLSGILIATILTGEYKFDPSTINVTQIIFSLNPGIWEEFFFRGVIMILLLSLTKSIRTSSIIQIVLFGIMHIKDISITGFFEIFSVMILGIGFTYVTYKTKSLLAGMIFHYLHDAFLFAVQLPSGIYTGTKDNALFYAGLWSMIAVGCLITKVSSEKMNIRSSNELYIIPVEITTQTSMAG